MNMLLKPRLSEKAYAMSEQLNTYVFDVSVDANKLQLAAAVSSQYQVGVKKVRIAGVPGKSKRSYRRASRSWNRGKSSPLRKAYVTLKEGEKLPFFAGVEESTKNTSKEKT